MARIKSFALSIVLLSSFNAFGMEHDCMASMEHMDIGAKKIGKPQDNVLRKIWERIDKDYVGVPDSIIYDYSFLRPFVGMGLSYYKGRQIEPKQAAQELQQIELWIKESTVLDDQKHGRFTTLIANHWYVNYLMKALVDEKVCILENVTGLNIDELYFKRDNVDKKSVDGSTFSDAYTKFIKKHLGKALTDIVPQVISDIHFIALEHPRGNVKPDSLMMSDDGKYLQAKTETDWLAVWDMHHGSILDKQDKVREVCYADKGFNGDLDINQFPVFFNRIKTSYIDDSQQKQNLCGAYGYDVVERYRVADKNDQYCAMMSDAYTVIDSEFLPKDAQNNPKTIILFKRPQEVSYLCQRAFDNSYMSAKALQALRDSKAFNSIEGFPRINLEKVIDNKIKALSAK